jgi:tetratricopeptide (TPR) repeat protein
VNKGVANLDHLRNVAQTVNRKVLEVERLSHHCVLTQDALDRLQQPTVEAGQRVSALRFGDPRVMALLQALVGLTHLPHGFRNRDLRPHVAALLGRAYTGAQMTYDLRRLRLKGLLHRIPHTHRYTATSYGLKVAIFYAKLYLRIFRPHWPALLPDDDRLPRPLRLVLEQLDREIHKLHQEAKLGESSEALARLREGEQLLERSAASGIVDQNGWDYHLLGRSALLLGRLDDARRFADRAIEFSRSHPGFAAHAQHLLGDVATHPDPFDAARAEAHYRQALALAERCGMRPLIAHCHRGLGRLYRRTGQQQEAHEHLGTATRMYREMNMRFYLEKAEAEMSLAPSTHATPASGLA